MSTDPALPLPRRILHFLGLQRSTIAVLKYFRYGDLGDPGDADEAQRP